MACFDWQVAADKAHIRRNPHRPLPEDSEEQRTKMTKRTVYAVRKIINLFSINSAPAKTV